MNSSFPRILTMLRKERNISQKEASAALGISQALLSHYERGIRECKLDFVVKIADYYGVSCDFLLGRSPEKTGTRLSVDDIPDSDTNKDNQFSAGSILPTLNKKLIFNSANIIFDVLGKYNNKTLTNEVSNYFMVAVYKMFRLIYSINPKNPTEIFALPDKLSRGCSTAALEVTETNIEVITSGKSVGNITALENVPDIRLSSEIINSDYPMYSTSIHNVIQSAESRMGVKNNKGKG